MSDVVPSAGPARLSAKDLITLACAIIGASVVIGGAIRSDGSREQRLQVVEQRIDAMEKRGERREDLLNNIDVRTARIEATLQMMTKASAPALASR